MRQGLRSFFLFAAVLLAVAGSGRGGIAALPDSAQVVAVVNGEPITVERVERELLRIHRTGARDTSRAEFSLEKLVQRLVNDCLLAQEARAMDMDKDSALAARVKKYRDQLALREMMRTLFPDTFTADEEALRAEYERQFRRYEWRMISVNDSALAAALADSIRGGASMAQLAQAHSIDRYREKEGYAGYWRLWQIPVGLRPYIEAAQVGELLGPLNAWRAHVLIRIEAVLPPDSVPALDSVRAQLVPLVVAAKRKRAIADFVAAQKAKLRVEVDSVAADSMLVRMSLGLSPSPATLLRVGDQVLTETEARNAYIHASVGRVDRDPRRQLREVLEEKETELVLRAAAAQSAFAHGDAVQSEVRAYEDSLLVHNYLEEVVAAKVEVSDAEVGAYYEKHRLQFRAAPRDRIATLTRATEAEAEEDYERLRAGTDFAWLARQHSVDEARMRGGERDWAAASEFPSSIAAALDTLPAGGFTRPVKTDAGYIILRLLERKEGDLLPLDAVRETIRARLRFERELAAIESTLRTLRAAAEIELRPEVLQRLQIQGTFE